MLGPYLDVEMLGVTFVLVIMSLVGLIMLVNAILFVLYCIGLSSIAKKEGHENILTAWVPLLNVIYLARVSEKNLPSYMENRYTIIQIILVVSMVILQGTTYMILCLVMILTIYSTYTIVGKYSKHKNVHLIIMVITLGMSIPVHLFWIRNKEKIEKDRREDMG